MALVSQCGQPLEGGSVRFRPWQFDTEPVAQQCREQTLDLEGEPMKVEIDPNWPQTWEEIFAGVPTAPGTEAQQQRHKQLREQDDMTEEEEAELNELFYAIYPQLKPRLVREGELKKPQSYCRACGTPLPHEDECCIQHAKKLMRKMRRYWITQGFHLRDVRPDGTLFQDMAAQKSGRKPVTLSQLLYADRTDFQICPGDERVAADITVAELKEMIVAVNASNEQIRSLYEDVLRAEARIGKLEFLAVSERSLREWSV
jgi:hypothetical protein